MTPGTSPGVVGQSRWGSPDDEHIHDSAWSQAAAGGYAGRGLETRDGGALRTVLGSPPPRQDCNVSGADEWPEQRVSNVQPVASLAMLDLDCADPAERLHAHLIFALACQVSKMSPSPSILTRWPQSANA